MESAPRRPHGHRDRRQREPAHDRLRHRLGLQRRPIVFGSVQAGGTPVLGGYTVAWLTLAAAAVIAGIIVLAVRPIRRRAAVADDTTEVESAEVYAEAA